MEERRTAKERGDLEAGNSERGESRARLEGLLTAITDYVFFFDSEGRFVECHAPSVADLYLAPSEFLGKLHSEVMPAHVDELFRKALDVNRSGEVAEYEYGLDVASGQRRFRARLAPIILDGAFAGSVAVIKTFPGRRREEGKRARLVETLERALAIAREKE